MTARTTQEQRVHNANTATMKQYFAELVSGGDFSDIPMRDDLRFRGPLATSDTAVEYRAVCQEFAGLVTDLSLRTLVGDDGVIHAVYDVDMGLPSGPLATSQTVEFVDGQFASVEVIFDAAVITGLAS